MPIIEPYNCYQLWVCAAISGFEIINTRLRRDTYFPFQKASHAAKMQLRAMAAGEIKPLPPDAGRHAHDYRLNPDPLNATFDCYARAVLRVGPDILD